MLIIAILCLGVASTLAQPIEKAAENYFLPDNAVLPENYNVEIDVTNSFKELKYFMGIVEITARINIDKLNKIVLHAADMSEFNISVTANGTKFNQNHSVNNVTQFLTIPLTAELKKDTIVKIHILYKGTLQTDMNGFYISSYTQTGSKTKFHVLTTQFQPTNARKAFPCFDEPKYKATFNITIKKPKQYGVISNMPTLTDTNDGRFQKTINMSTYLVAFIVSEFVPSNLPNLTHYKVWSRPEAINQTKTAVAAMDPIINELNNFTGIMYSKYVPKMDMAALPDFAAGAMENWGLLTYRETALLVDDKVSTNRDIQRVVTVIAHEIAHQWFGDLVTLTWWNNTWLNEGFARYFEYHTTGNYKPDWEMKEQFVVEQHQSIFEVDALKKTTPLTLSVTTPKEINAHFGTISYNKGASVIRMMEHFLGSNVFQNGLKHYLAVNSLKNTVPKNLWNALEEKAQGKDKLQYTVEEIMAPWIAQPGYPLVNVIINDKNVTFEQSRFFLNPEEKVKSNLWYVPISYSTCDTFQNTKPQLWLTPTEPKKTIPITESKCFIANVQQSGYYRVNYNENHWEKIVKTLNRTNNIHRINRAQIVDDVMSLARAGVVDYKLAFNITDYLKTESDYFPWFSAFRGFRFLLQRFAENEETGIAIRKYLLSLMSTLLKQKDFIDNTKDKQISIFNAVNALEWACNLQEDSCITKAKNLFTNIETIPKNFRSIVYCTAIRHGSKQDWDKLWNKFKNSNVAAEKIGIINALGCSNKTNILSNYLDLSLSDDVRSQDASYVFSAVYTGSPEGVDVANKFLIDKHTDIIKKYGGMNALDTAVLGLAGRLNNEAKIKEFAKFLNANDVFKNIREAAIETANENNKWAKTYGDTIGKIMKEKNSAINIIINKYVIFLSLGFISFYVTMFK